MRHEISEEIDHDPKRLLEYCRKLEPEYADRLVHTQEEAWQRLEGDMAVAERLSALRTEAYFHQRTSRADNGRAREILKRTGKGDPPVPGDELPMGATTGKATDSG